MASSKKSKFVKLIIIGGGISALTAGLYTARAGLVPLIFEGSADAGGQLTKTSDISNFPSTPVAGIDGFELISAVKKQVEHFNAKIISETVVKLSYLKKGKSKGKFEIETDSGSFYVSQAVILATGANSKYLGLKGEQEFLGKGFSTCAVCDGALPRFKNKDLAVVGGGDSAMEESLFLTKFAKTVYLVHRKPQLGGSQFMRDRVRANKKIKVVESTTVIDVLGDSKTGVSGLKIRTGSDSVSQLNVSGFFVAIGHKPNSELVKGLLDLDSEGYITNLKSKDAQQRAELGVKTSESSHAQTATKIAGLFVAGDLVDKVYRQAITASGDGCKAGLDAIRFLESI